MPAKRRLQLDRAISASRRVEAPSRHRRDSCPSHDDVGGLFFEFEAVRTDLTEMLRAGHLPRGAGQAARGDDEAHAL